MDNRGVFISLHDAWVGQLHLNSLQAVKTYAAADLVKNHRGHRDILRLRVTGSAGEETTLYLKRIWQPNKKDGLKSLLSRGRVWSVSRQEWENSLLLQQAGIATPERVAMGEEVGWCFEKFSFILTAAAPGTPLDDCLRALPPDPAARRRLVEEAGRFVRRLHEAGFFTPDLFARHIFVSGPPSSPRFTLIDMARLDRAPAGGSRASRLAARDLAALHVSIPQSLLGRADRFRFLQAYGGEIKRWVPAIRRRALHLLKRRKYRSFFQ